VAAAESADRGRLAAMAQTQASPDWLDELREEATGPSARWKVSFGTDLSRRTTLRIGGPADCTVEAGDTEAVRCAVTFARERELPLTVLGGGANVLVPDDGRRGLVLRLGGGLRGFEREGEQVRAGGATVLGQVARSCAREGLGGLEALGGFPASVGGAVAMNAGCYGTEISEVLRDVELVDRHGRVRRVPPAALDPGYRSTSVRANGEIVTTVRFALRPGDPREATRRLEELNRRRWESLPSGQPNAGSIFRNPEGDHAGRLIEACGLKGLRIGGAVISAKHANVIVNPGEARASDVVDLMSRAREEVSEGFGVLLRPELVLLGCAAETWRRRFGEERKG